MTGKGKDILDGERQVAEAADSEVQAEQAEAEATETQSAEPEATLADLQNRLLEAEDKFMRAQAEVENIRKRAAKDVEKAHKYALEGCLHDLIPVLDSLEQAISHTDDKEPNENSITRLRQGVEICYNLFLKTLTSFGIKQLNPIGERFNPEEQEALSMVPNAEAEPGEVLEVFQCGYLLNGRLIRAAKVIVARPVKTETAKTAQKSKSKHDT